MVERSPVRRTVVFILLAILAASTLLPIGYMILVTFLTKNEYMLNVFALPSSVNFSNYKMVLESFNFLRMTFNSLVISGTTVFFSMFFTSLCAYSLVKLPWKGKGAVKMAIIAGMFMPGQVLILPVYQILIGLDLVNNMMGLVIFYVAISVPFTVMMMMANLAVAWSGNWQLVFTEKGTVEFCFTAEMFTANLQPGESLFLPKVIVAGNPEGLTPLREQMASWLEGHWFPKNRLNGPYVEWNHWWTYEDAEINEEIFCRNVDEAAKLGIDICTLDAGWFGNPENPAHWSQCRGDWNLVNQERFPRGLRWLGEYIHSKGMKFGLWLEPEAMGNQSELLKNHPEWEARRDGASLPDPYLCLGAKGAEDWLYNTIAAIADDTKCDWFKLDFNIDPEFGCNRADHGHGAGVGLFAHYQGYYNVLKRLRQSHPHVILENCSSGGLRLDAGMMQYADVTFLSDPDELAHSLQCFWGAGMLFPPARLLHWAGSETREYPDGSHVFPNFPIHEDTPDWKIKAVLRGGMLHRIGFSRNLTALPTHAKELWKKEIAFYKEEIFPIIETGKLYLLTGQPLRSGERCDDNRNPPPQVSAFAPAGEGAAFMVSNGTKACVTVFAVEDPVERQLPLQGLAAVRLYCVTNADTGEAITASGNDLLQGGIQVLLKQGHSALFMVEWVQE